MTGFLKFIGLLVSVYVICFITYMLLLYDALN